MTEVEYDEAMTEPKAHETLWRTVLMAAIEDALTGAQIGSTKAMKIRETQEARAYIIEPHRDFIELCNLAGLDPVAVREHLLPRIAAAPAPEQLFEDRKPRRATRSAETRKSRTKPKRIEGRSQ